MAKKILIGAYYFPPCGGVAAFRVAKFTKYLQRFGWEPVVVTVEPEYYNNIDNDLLAGNISDNTIVYKTRVFLKKLLKNPGVCWIFPLMNQIKKTVKEHEIDAIFMTGDPWFQFITAAWAKKRYKIPYILDFRDEWALNVYRDNKNLKDKLKTFIASTVEKYVLQRADKVIVVNDQMKQLYEEYYGNNKEIAGKFVTISNGYDIDDYSEIATIKSDKLSIVYTGKFAGFRNPEIFLEAFKRLTEGNEDIRFIHVGNEEEYITKAIESKKLNQYVENVGFKPYKQSLGYAKGADLLLLIGGDSKVEQTAKVFDYIGCGRPILALAREDGSVADIIRKTGCGHIIENNIENVDKIVNYIKNFIAGEKEGYNPKEIFEKYLPEYNRIYLTKKLAEVLDEIKGKDK